MSQKYSILVLSLLVPVIGMTAGHEEIPVQQESMNVKAQEYLVTNPKLRFSSKKLTLDAADASIRIVAKVEGAPQNDELALRCLNAQSYRVESMPDGKMKWKENVKILKKMGIREIDVRVRVASASGSAPQVSAYVKNPDKLFVLISVSKDDGNCQVAKPIDATSPAELLKAGTSDESVASGAVAGQSNKTIVDVVRDWSNGKAGVSSGKAAH